jgi:hypothetical protein
VTGNPDARTTGVEVSVGGSVGGHLIAGDHNVITTHAPGLDLAALKPRAASVHIAGLPTAAAVGALAALAPAAAGEILTYVEPAKAVAYAGHMNSERFAAIVAHVSEPLASVLRDALRADEAIAGWEAEHPAVGRAVGDDLVLEGSPLGTAGFRRTCEHGAIYWSARTGLVPVMIGIAAHYERCGGVGGRLGFPVREAEAVPIPTVLGLSQRFEGLRSYPEDVTERLGVVCGATVYVSLAGTFVVDGVIGEAYERWGGPGGDLGMPAGEAVDEGDGRVSQRFARGAIYWRRDAEAGPVSSRFAEMTGELGFPVAPVVEKVSRSGVRGELQFFELGAVVAAPTGQWSMSDGEARYWSKRIGDLGFPRGAAVDRSVGGKLARVRQYEQGAIVLQMMRFPGLGHGAQFAFSPRHLPGAVALTYADVAVAERLGLPTSKPRLLDAGPDLVQFFEHGAVAVVKGVARVMYGDDPRPSAGFGLPSWLSIGRDARIDDTVDDGVDRSPR